MGGWDGHITNISETKFLIATACSRLDIEHTDTLKRFNLYADKF